MPKRVLVAAMSLLILLVLPLGAARTARSVQAQADTPTFVPDLFGPGGGGCVNQPAPVIDASWQTSAPRSGSDSVYAGDSLQIGLRNKFDGPNDVYSVAAEVIAPDGSVTVANTVVSGSDWAYLTYPDDFAPAYLAGTFSGTFTIVWETESGFLACDGFTVQGG